ncbi:MULTISPECIES: ubiquitin-like small modifier protein 1 [Brevibacillus]|jgi:molybdopterin synthase sulfur carrier subunit|uniref:MoaD family protein n=1 Tax=Brevibacillus borstelensis AK1 TaxID=1300222 RepID=M8DHR8_9BACL|nr:ubiquitin-like small modifier protein 1 [Brevibacillus borstelensis]EMT52977.1 MoaD family protein [Brevibacillus borstelensis AK1]KKX55611.1 molybdenum biosynthesis protein MoaD [Brevibacillus borstelensis cifa_chp40]MBE5397050.1 MoaD/ThiS family protein [Brevibacillus borstelensis]MCC0563388.1 MoaD/ThiS family protein [Brevibacillus borstelensis]MCM3471399.1 MoaD/ThiS family protein [Brevibacillus borstelensis]
MIVKVFANFREICQAKTVEVPTDNGNRVIDILETLIRMFPALEEEVFTPERTLKPFVHVFINGRNVIHADGLETRVQEDDQFALFPPVAGG